MEPEGRIYSPQEVEALQARVGESGVKRKLKRLVYLPEDVARHLTALPRAKRRAWYAEYRRAQKWSRKTGRPVVMPDLP